MELRIGIWRYGDGGIDSWSRSCGGGGGGWWREMKRSVGGMYVAYCNAADSDISMVIINE